MATELTWCTLSDLSSFGFKAGEMVRVILALCCLLMGTMQGMAASKAVVLLVLGDSLTAGYGLPPEQSFTAQLQVKLQTGDPDIKIVNASVSGDTAADGAARFDWALTPEVSAVIVELGANDALRGLDPKQTEAALDEILTKAKSKHLPVLLMGMFAPPNLGTDYGQAFNAIYPYLAEKHGVLIYPFFLEGVAGQRPLNQADGMHPNERGVAIIINNVMPAVQQLITTVKAPPG